MFKSLLPWKPTKTKVMVPEQTMEDDPALQEQPLVACNTCGRTFLPQPLKKHAPICEKSQSKRRKVFDSLKQRIEGTDLAQFHQKSYLKKQQEPPKPVEKPKKQWQEDHQKLVDAIRFAKESREMSLTSKKVATSPSNERCPHCERQFGPKAFDRHVEWCKEHSRTRVQKSPANVLLAKERLEARTKYKVPPLNKPKRLAVKEKYSTGNFNRTESVCSVKSTPTSLFRSPSVRKPNPKKPEVPKVDKAKSVLTLSDVKKKEQKNRAPYDPFASAERQFMELLECDDLFTTQRPHTAALEAKPAAKKVVQSAGAADKKRASVIDPPVRFQDAAEDDFEMLENLINSQFNSESDFHLLDKRDKDDFNVILNQRKYSDDLSSIDSNLINENDDLSIPEHFRLDDYSTEDTDATLRNSADNLLVEKKAATKGKSKSNCSFGKKEGKKQTTNKENGKKRPEMTFKPEDLFAVDDKMYAEYKIYEEMYLKEKEQLANSKKHRTKNTIVSYGIDLNERGNPTGKVSDDSAYGSLNRGSPVRRRVDSGSSSGSEPVFNPNQRMSKFCHECGSKYPLATAKFCVECGVKRLLL